MKLLVDEQLPPALAGWLREQGCEAWHVRELGLAQGEDREIWAQAAALGAVVITKDEDYVALARVRAGEVAVVWMRVGNCTNAALLRWFGPMWPEIRRRLEQGGATHRGSLKASRPLYISPASFIAASSPSATPWPQRRSLT